MARIGVFGGSFNPIHEGHVNFLRQVSKQLNFDEILLVVCRNALHKNVNLASSNDRFVMCKLAVSCLPNVTVSDLEFEIDKNGYSFYTLQKIKQKNEGKKLFLIVGPDSFLKINTWHRFRQILDLATVVSGYSNELEQAEMERLAQKFEFEPVLLKVNLSLFHSTKIRFRLAQGLNCSSFLNSNVLKHILQNKIYCGEDSLFVESENVCKNLLSKKRFEHCVCVSNMAQQLAKTYGENENYAKIAGMLHDVVKEQTPENLLKILKTDESINLNEIEKTSFKLWHAPAGAIYCKKFLGLENEKILNAIACHTTGKANMTIFDKIVLVADNISFDRKNSNAKIGRKLAFENLDQTVFFHIKNHIVSDCKKSFMLPISSVQCYNQLAKILNDESV